MRKLHYYMRGANISICGSGKAKAKSLEETTCKSCQAEAKKLKIKK